MSQRSITTFFKTTPRQQEHQGRRQEKEEELENRSDYLTGPLFYSVYSYLRIPCLGSLSDRVWTFFFNFPPLFNAVVSGG